MRAGYRRYQIFISLFFAGSGPVTGLGTRVVTGSALVTIVVGSMLLLPAAIVAIVLGGFLVGAAWEYAGLTPIGDTPYRVGYAGLIGVIAIAVWFHAALGVSLVVIMLAGAAWWIAALILVWGYHSGKFARGVHWVTRPYTGLLVLIPAWAVLTWLLQEDPAILLCLFVAVWTADAAAYFVGRRFGRRKLAVKVSPGKTWEGAIGGVVCGALAASASSFTLILSDAARLAFVCTVIVAIVFSIVGDLFESLLKRHAGVKDSLSLIHI